MIHDTTLDDELHGLMERFKQRYAKGDMDREALYSMHNFVKTHLWTPIVSVNEQFLPWVRDKPLPATIDYMTEHDVIIKLYSINGAVTYSVSGSIHLFIPLNRYR